MQRLMYQKSLSFPIARYKLNYKHLCRKLTTVSGQVEEGVIINIDIIYVGQKGAKPFFKLKANIFINLRV